MPKFTQDELHSSEYQYVLDCAVELGEITPLEASVYTVATPAAIALHALLTQQMALPSHFLRNTARYYLNSLPRHQKMVWALKSMPTISYALKNLQDRIAYAVQKKVQEDLDLEEPNPNSWMAEINEHSLKSVKVFNSVHDITPDNVLRYVEPAYRDALSCLEDDVHTLMDALTWVATAEGKAQAKSIALHLFGDKTVKQKALTASLVVPKVSEAKKLMALKRSKVQARGAIKKALKLFSSFGMEPQVRMLVSGEKVTLEHPESYFKLEVAPLQSNWLEQRTVAPGGHAPFQLSLLTKEDIFVARLCVLFDKTPVLDQLLALSMYVQTGNEMELLQKANWFGVPDVKVARQLLSEKAPELAAKLPWTLPESSTEPSGRSVRDGIANRMRQLDDQWAPYKAPVRQWLNNWFGPVLAGVKQLSALPCE